MGCIAADHDTEGRTGGPRSHQEPNVPASAGTGDPSTGAGVAAPDDGPDASPMCRDSRDCRVHRALMCCACRRVRAWLCLEREAMRVARLHWVPRGSMLSREDLGRDILVRVVSDDYRALKRANANARLIPWMRGVGRRIAREIRAARPLDPLADPEELLDEATGHADRAQLDEELRSLERACRGLAPEHREVVQLKRLGLTWGEMLEFVQCWEPTASKQTLRRRFRAARRHLRRHAQRPETGPSKKNFSDFGFFVTTQGPETH